MSTWKWIEESFEYDYDGEPACDKYGPRSETIESWLNRLESEKGYTVLELHITALERNYILAIAKIEFPSQGIREET